MGEQLAALCRAAGFYGVFQVEFIHHEGRLLLIDFNPRLYHYMAFEIARGMPLPLFAYHAATGDERALAELGAAARASALPTGKTFSDWLSLGVMLNGQRLTGKMSAGDVARWRRWYSEHRASMTDVSRNGRDHLPVLLDFAQRVGHWTSKPLASARKMLLNGD